MTTNKITVTLRKGTDAEDWSMDMQCLALLYGVPLTDINALPIANGCIRIPSEWVKRGKRRVKEAEAHTGSDFVLDIMQFWAQRDHGADLEVVYQ